MTVALRSRDDVHLCAECIGWLAGRIGIASTPTLPVTHIGEATAFYERAGFGIRRHSDGAGEGYAFVECNGQSVFDLEAAVDMDPTANRAGCYLEVKDADEWHARLSGAGLPVTELRDQPWEMREFALTDPSGNRVRIGHATGESPEGA